MARIDHTGKRYGRLQVIEYVADKRWRCICDCGKECLIPGRSFQRGYKSCGCLSRETAGNVHRRHGKSHTRIHNIWLCMKARCKNPAHDAYPHYGGKGITVCERWLSFDNFLEDMGDLPSDQHEIDRIDSNGNYEPGNCRWVTKSQQMQNRGKSSMAKGSKFKGVAPQHRRWRAVIRHEGRDLYLGTFATDVEAAKAYDAAAIKFFKEFACTNFP